jgi:hypothetical protein
MSLYFLPKTLKKEKPIQKFKNFHLEIYFESEWGECDSDSERTEIIFVPTKPANCIKLNRAMSSSFELIAKSSLACCIPVEKYKSNRTGMQLYVCNVKGPVVDGYISLATEADSDDGLPHTLEVHHIL